MTTKLGLQYRALMENVSGVLVNWESTHASSALGCSSHYIRIPNERSIVKQIPKHRSCEQKCRDYEFHDVILWRTDGEFNANKASFDAFRQRGEQRLYTEHLTDIRITLVLSGLALSGHCPIDFGQTNESRDTSIRNLGYLTELDVVPLRLWDCRQIHLVDLPSLNLAQIALSRALPRWKKCGCERISTYLNDNYKLRGGVPLKLWDYRQLIYRERCAVAYHLTAPILNALTSSSHEIFLTVAMSS